MRVSVAVAVACFSVAGFSAADDVDAAVRKTTNIPAQGLGPALQLLAKDRGFQIVYVSDEVNSLRTQGATGELTREEALTQLLHGTGLAYRSFGDDAVSVVAVGASTSPSGFNPISFNGDTDREGGESAGGPPRLRLAQADPASQTEPSLSARESSSGSPRGGIDAPQNMVALEEIIVTAQKREERLIDTPQSVTVLSSDALAKLGATQFRDFANSVPGLSFTTAGPGSTKVTLRGVTVGLDLSPTVGIYVDEVPYGSSTIFASSVLLALDVGLFDLERIEVLRGPQGTLYGASTMGGLLKYVSTLPSASDFGGSLLAGVSSTAQGDVSYNVSAAANMPLASETAALRVSGFYSRDGGYIDNLALGEEDVNSSDIYGGRADLLLTPTDALNIRITGFAQDILRDGEATADYDFSGVPLDGRLDQRHLIEEPFDQRFRLISGTITYDFGPASLTSISSYQTAQTDFVWDASPAYVPLLNDVLGFGPYSAVGLPAGVTTDKFTQEVRLASQGAAVLEWLIGGFYTDESTDVTQEFLLLDPSGQPAPNNLYTYRAPIGYEEYAAFGDLTWRLTQKFDVTGGVRFARNRQSFEQIGSGIFVGSRPTTRSTEEVFTYLANARYHFSDHATAYLRYATGYRPGGPNFVILDTATGLPVGPTTFEADRLKSYELGIKTETADRRFGLDLATYYIDWSNIQISVIRSGVGFNDNAPGGADVRGAEVTLSARSTSGLSITGAFAYQDAQLSEANPDLGGAAGERLPDVPRFTAALNADYELPVGALRPRIGMTLRHIGERTTSFNNSLSRPQYRLPDYQTVDLRAGMTLGPVDLQLSVHNLFDEHGQLSLMQPQFGGRVGILRPRTIGMTAITRF